MTEPDEFDLDQTTRVRARAAHGAYRVTRGKTVIGEELWQILRLRSGMTRVMTEISMRWPVAHQHRVRFDLGETWQPDNVWAEVESQGSRFNGHFTREGEAVLHARTRRTVLQRLETPKKKTPSPEPEPLQTFRTAPTKIILNEPLAFGDDVQIDFNSPLFSFVILRRLAGAAGRVMEPGAVKTFGSVVITLPHLKPIRATQTYTCVDQAPPPGKTFGYPVWHYRITEPGNAGAQTEMWCNAHHIPVQMEVTLNGVAHLTELTSFHWRDVI